MYRVGYSLQLGHNPIYWRFLTRGGRHHLKRRSFRPPLRVRFTNSPLRPLPWLLHEKYGGYKNIFYKVFWGADLFFKKGLHFRTPHLFSPKNSCLYQRYGGASAQSRGGQVRQYHPSASRPAGPFLFLIRHGYDEALGQILPRQLDDAVFLRLTKKISGVCGGDLSVQVKYSHDVRSPYYGAGSCVQKHITCSCG